MTNISYNKIMISIDPQEIADIYNQFGRTYHESRQSASGRLHNEYIDMPATWSLLPTDLTGKMILDAGCGSGIYAKLLAEKGATVYGVDISEEMIKIAKEETPPALTITYSVGDVQKLQFNDASMDIILATYVLENVPDLQKTFQEFYRVLKPGGSFIASMSHPLRAASTQNTADDKEIWMVTNYFEEGVRTSDFGGGMMVPKHKRTMQEYVETATAAGFTLKHLLEPTPTPEGKAVDEKGYEVAMRLPQILTIQLTK